jgi:EF hand domain-containing protein
MLRSYTVVLTLIVIGAANAEEPQAAPATEQAKVASEQLAELKKAAAEAAAKTQAAIAQAAAVRPPLRGSPERQTVDPQDAVERFALLTAGGPLIVRASLTIDGQPFRLGREKLLAEMIAAADTDKDGQTTWSEAMSSSRFTFGRLGNANEQVRQSIRRTLDINSNSLVEPSEARQFLAQYSQGATFSFGGGPTALRVVVAGMLQATTARHPDVLPLLDTDMSKSLDAKELATAYSRLKSRDLDDNDVLDSSEVTGEISVGMYRLAVDRPTAAPPSDAILLGPTATTDAVYSALRQKYKNAQGHLAFGCFPLFSPLFAALDRDQSKTIESREVLVLNDVAPHVELTVDLATQGRGAGLKITSLAAGFQNAVDQPGNQVLELPGVRISLAANTATLAVRNYDATANALLRQFDNDGNGYLEKSEALPLAAQFEIFDEDGDGKAYPAEIAAGYARQAAPQLTQIVANVVQQSNSLFQTLDTNGDGRLGLREMRSAAERLAALDKDHDQSIGGTEIPEAISVSFAMGTGGGPVLERQVAQSNLPGRATGNVGPEWFTRMDRNGDGDVTLKEFLGSEADFLRLDTDGDGLIDPQEAKAVGS